MSWKSVKTPKVENFIAESGDATLTIIKSGFANQYHIVEESAIDGKNRHDDAYTKEEIANQFNIEISI